MRTTGDYVMFCDSDDKYLPIACETVIREMDSNPVDILHFRSQITYCRVFDEEKKNSICSFIEPYLGKVCGDLQKECFINKKWEFTLWNKAFNAEACRKAFALASDENFSVATDVYAFFLISYFCRTYRGIPVALNEYRYGSGVTGFQVMNEQQFYKTCEKLISVNQLKPFLDKVCAPDYCYRYAEDIRSQIVNGIIYTWFKTVSISDASKCFWHLIKYLSPSELMGILARKYWDNYDKVAIRVTAKRVRFEAGKKVSRIAVYYSSIRNGGAQKVVAQADAYCGWLFGILFRLEEKLDISGYDAKDRRVFGYVAERLIDTWLNTNHISYRELPVVNLERQNWLKKGGMFLVRKWRGGER